MKTIPSNIIRNDRDLAALGILVGFVPKYWQKAIEQYEFASPLVHPKYHLSWTEFVDSLQHIRSFMTRDEQLQDLWHTIMGTQLASQVHQWAYKES